MKKNRFYWMGFAVGAVLILASASAVRRPADQPLSGGGLNDPKVVEARGRLPVDFIPNLGQADPEVLFYAQTRGGGLWLTKEGLVHDEARLVFRGGRADVRLRPLEPAGHAVHSFIGNDPSRWKTDLPAYRAVIYEGIYDGIDLELYGREGRIEYDWRVRPGSDPDDIRFEFRGGGGADIDRDGNLIVRTPAGDLVHRKPVSRQVKDGRTAAVDVRFKKAEEGVFGFDVPAYDPEALLVIDPVVFVSSTYLGGRDNDAGTAVAVDRFGYIYIAGCTSSTNFPVKDALFSTARGGADIFLTKLSRDGRSIVFSTYFGGRTNNDYVAAVSVDGTGAVFLAGWTRSSDFPMKRAYDPHGGEGGVADGFVTKFAPSGSALVFSTYLGGSDEERISGMAIDGTGAVYAAGVTYSADFPVKNAFDATLDGETDAFLTKFKPTGRGLVYSTYLGGSGNDNGYGGVAVDASHAAYVTGYTGSSDFPVANAFDAGFGGEYDGFFAKFNPAGSALVFASYLGGRRYDLATACAVDDRGSLYVAGLTRSRDFPVRNPYDATWNGKEDAFLTKVAPTGQSLVYSTFLGGTAQDEAYAVAVDSSRCATVAGNTRSSPFPLKEAADTIFAGYCETFVTKFGPSGSGLIYSTYLGGSLRDEFGGLALTRSGAAVVTGRTDSEDFPLANPYDSVFNGGWYDAYLTRISVATEGRRSP